MDMPREAAARLFNGPCVLTKNVNDENHIRCSPTGYTCVAVCHEQKAAYYDSVCMQHVS